MIKILFFLAFYCNLICVSSFGQSEEDFKKDLTQNRQIRKAILKIEAQLSMVGFLVQKINLVCKKNLKNGNFFEETTDFLSNWIQIVDHYLLLPSDQKRSFKIKSDSFLAEMSKKKRRDGKTKVYLNIFEKNKTKKAKLSFVFDSYSISDLNLTLDDTKGHVSCFFTDHYDYKKIFCHENANTNFELKLSDYDHAFTFRAETMSYGKDRLLIRSNEKNGQIKIGDRKIEFQF